MLAVSSYMHLPYDVSGAISKNRFRNEMLWGLQKILELYKTGENFTVVFDYKSDIEVHFSDHLEFYQLKTQNDHGTYSIGKLIKRSKSGLSVLGKLYVLKFDEHGNEQDDTLIAVVSNAPLNDGEKTHTGVESVLLSAIDSSAVTQMKDAITKELSLSVNAKLNNAFFTRTSLDLINPQKTLIGELSLFFEEIFEAEPKKINSLYRVLSEEILTRASYELELPAYDDILDKKGVNRTYFQTILHKYVDHTDAATSRASEYIDAHHSTPFKTKIEFKRALNRIITDLPLNKYMKALEQSILDYIRLNLSTLPDAEEDIMDTICKDLQDSKPVEMSVTEFRVLVLVTLKRYEEGIY